ncbi:MAG: TolB-like 6-bladed beta-propeller domain-containing protein [Clostridiales bacterium]|nr:TolB-like 6-bladed beta-propeller domain-containing protein [Clostridiales bacterium]
MHRTFTLHLSVLLMAIPVLSIISSCGSKKPDEVIPIEVMTQDVDLSGQELIMGTPIISRVGKYLVIDDFKSDSVITVIDSESATILGTFLSQGQGPGEFGNLTLIGLAGDNELLISDPLKKQVTSFKIDDASDKVIIPVAQLTPQGKFWSMNRLANGQYVTSNGYDEYLQLFTIYNSDGSLASRCGNRLFPDENKDQRPVDLTAAYQYTLSVSPDGRRIAAVNMGENAMFFELSGDSLVMTGKIFNPEAEPDHVFTADGYMGISGKSNKPWGFISGAVTQEGVYILKSDIPFSEDSSWTGRQLLYYDWEGNLVADYRLDRRISNMTAPGPDGTMYAIVVDDCDPTLVAINLPR